MTETAILFASGLLLLAYFVNVAGRRYRLPSVVLLIASGIALRHLLDPVGVELTWIAPVVPVVGTLGLILIVLEGALDLNVTRGRLRLIAVSATSALLGFAATLAVMTILFVNALGMTNADAILAAIPFSVISSAVAIPSASGLAAEPREFVIYESSLSDIIGVLVFYAWLAAEGSAQDFAIDLFGGGAISLTIALLVAPMIFFFLNRVDGHVRFLPLIAGIVFLYAAGKASQLSPLVLVLGCGLLLNNPQLANWSRRLSAWRGDDYPQTLKEFKGLVAELTFATKSFFFLLLGYWTTSRRWHRGARGLSPSRCSSSFSCRAGDPSRAATAGRVGADLDRAARTHHRAAVPRRRRGGKAAWIPVRLRDARGARDERGDRTVAPGREAGRAPDPGAFACAVQASRLSGSA